MTLTELDARKKFCPFSFTAVPVVNEYGAEIQCSGPWTCKGSECMAWRADPVSPEWDELVVNRLRGEDNPPFSNCPDGWEVLSYGTGSTYKVHRKRDPKPATGYCGLAGKP